MNRLSTQNDLEPHPTELNRIATQGSQHAATVGSSRTNSCTSNPLPAFGAGKPYPPLLPTQESYVVEFDRHDDPLHAQNWPLHKKILTAIMLGYTTVMVAFASSIFSSTTQVVASS
jgi:DHA1 family multidrug resistance protein-like MFS transporter